MKNPLLFLKRAIILSLVLFTGQTAFSQIIISQYYEGAGTNKWVELTNTTNAAINTASPQLKLGLWAVTGSTGNIALTGAPTNTVNLTVTIPAYGTVLIGNTGNGTEIPYLTAASAAMTSNAVINFNGNDGVALLDASSNILDAFGTGINATDISYVRSTAVTSASATYVPAQWSSATIATVQTAGTSDANRLNYHLSTACVAPANSPTGLTFGSPTSTSLSGSFTATTADEYLVAYSTSSSLTASPTNGTVYNIGNVFGNATVLSRGTSTSFNATGLSSSTTYYFYVFSLNSVGCTGGPAYKTTSPLSGSSTTLAPPCVAPANQPTALVFNSPTHNVVSGSFTATTANAYLVVYSTAASLTASPTNGTSYTAGNVFGNATVVSSSSATSFSATGLTPSTTYYITVFALNNVNCSAGPVYKTTTPLTGSSTTIAAPLNYYFGNFHSHSEYSDGTGLPSGDFAYGDTANCMDFLGISEHNHVSAGMSLANWSLGRSQATAATTSTFLAMYGMEWGVISGGGHVLVYGVPNLLGWDAGQYQTYVPQSVYTGTTGLFNTINGFGNNAFATLAHPNNADYNGIMSTYDAVADDAIVGSAVENGPSSSTNTTYTDPPSPMLYLSFYRNMLSRGYHLGPTMDHDNHNVTHGHTATTRTVVLSPSLTEADILSSMRLMRFYASEDCAAYVTFKINNNPIGSIVTAAGTPTITVTTSTSSAVTSLKIYSGVSGSGSNATILTSTTSGSITYTHSALTNLSSRYYYIDITESNGNRIVTAPIWYTRNDAARMSNPSAIAEFFTIAEPKQVVLKWITTHESNDQMFTIEKSTDNEAFELMETQVGKGTSQFPNNYTATDVSSQNDGITYYRLTQYSEKGEMAYTETKKVTRNIEPQFDVVIFPNPVSDKTTIQLNNTHGEMIDLAIFDLMGQKVYSKTMQSEQGNQEIALPLQSLKTGVYLFTLRSGNHVVNTKISKL
ncbi:CehA/McbA family metallohydrolase [Flavobacterium sp.]|uniref:CehA/McbA family metallohydrolase n=1 Tax=Flavobacterium sp. TaxID=239 RepID=UPI00286D05D5|nr:CehA/McbA family metallohydrolase [Flavobacterium sp.]